MSKKAQKNEKKTKVSKKRELEIEGTFRALNLASTQPYQGATEISNGFQRVSLYETGGYSFFTSNKACG